MTRERASIFGDDQDDDIDIGSLKPTAARRPDPEAVRRVAEAGGFSSREPTPAPPAPDRPRRGRPRTGRTHQINIKASADTLTRFFALCDQLRLSQAEAFERAVAALELKVNEED